MTNLDSRIVTAILEGFVGERLYCWKACTSDEPISAIVADFVTEYQNRLDRLNDTVYDGVMNTTQTVSTDGSIESRECMAQNNWNGARCHRTIQVLGFLEFDDGSDLIGRCDRHANDGFVVVRNADSH